MATAHKRFALTFVVCAGLCGANVRSAGLSARQGSPTFSIGHTPAPDRLKRIDIDVTPDGVGLLPGSGTAAKGKDVFTRRCETCHGPTGTEGLWDYINRAMPFDHPSTLTPDEVYSAAAYVLFLNGIVGEQDVLDQTTLPKVQMPNRNGFVADPRPDTPLKKK